MKKQRYKFDDAWRVAMITADVDNPGRIERMIRAYIEDDIEPESTFAIERTFRGAWTVIKAQIKARKERNRRAAERRRQRRQEALAAKAVAEAAQTAPAADRPNQSCQEDTQTSPHTSQGAVNAARPTTGRTASTSRKVSPASSNHTQPQPCTTDAPRIPTSPHPKKLKFSDRFRGPGLKAHPT